MKIIIRIFLYFQHIWKLFIGFLSKKKIHSNNPQLSRLMESNLSFKELEIKRKKLINKKLKLCAELNAFKYNKMERGIDYNILDFNEKNDKISQINSLLKGIEVKLRKIGYVYEYIKEIVAKNEFNEKILLKNRCEIILEKNMNYH